MSQFFISGGQSIGDSTSPPLLPMNIQDWFPLGWTGSCGYFCLKKPLNQDWLQHRMIIFFLFSFQFSSVQSLTCVRLFATLWIAACQASLSITNSRSSLRRTSIESVMPSSHLILCRPLVLLPPIPPSMRGFSNEPTLRMRWPKYWSFSFSIIPSKEHPGMISFRMDWLDLLAVQGTLPPSKSQ